VSPLATGLLTQFEEGAKKLGDDENKELNDLMKRIWKYASWSSITPRDIREGRPPEEQDLTPVNVLQGVQILSQTAKIEAGLADEARIEKAIIGQQVASAIDLLSSTIQKEEEPFWVYAIRSLARGLRTFGSPPTWFVTAVLVDHMGEGGEASDITFEGLESMLLGHEYAEIDSFLESVTPTFFSTDLLLTILTATFAAKSHLGHRHAFFNETKNVIEERGQLEDGLLEGLE
jgi:hypothetical protein